jgi:hypothetical protein
MDGAGPDDSLSGIRPHRFIISGVAEPSPRQVQRHTMRSPYCRPNGEKFVRRSVLHEQVVGPMQCAELHRIGKLTVREICNTLKIRERYANHRWIARIWPPAASSCAISILRHSPVVLSGSRSVICWEGSILPRKLPPKHLTGQEITTIE